MPNEAIWRRIPLAGAGIFLAVAATLLFGVIPRVGTDPNHQSAVERAMHDYATSAFHDTAIFHGVLGISLLTLVPLRAGRARKVLLAIVGALGLFAFLVLLDAASSSHGAMAVILFACAGGDFVVAGLALAAAFVRGGSLAKGEAT